jgi:hypothetical protein
MSNHERWRPKHRGDTGRRISRRIRLMDIGLNPESKSVVSSQERSEGLLIATCSEALEAGRKQMRRRKRYKR